MTGSLPFLEVWVLEKPITRPRVPLCTYFTVRLLGGQVGQPP